MRLTSLKSITPAITSPLTLICLLLALVLSTLASMRLSAALNLQAQLDAMQFDVTEWISESDSPPSFADTDAGWLGDNPTASATSYTQETRLPLVLEAAMAASMPEKASAFIRLPDGKTAYFRPGDTVMDDITLSEVHRDHVLLNHNGSSQRLSFPDPQQAAAFSGAPVQPAADETYNADTPIEPVERGELSEADAPSMDYETAQQEAVRRRLMQIRDQSRAGNRSE